MIYTITFMTGTGPYTLEYTDLCEYLNTKAKLLVRGVVFTTNIIISKR